MLKSIFSLAAFALIAGAQAACTNDIEDRLDIYPVATVEGAAYYVDAERGDDRNDGLSPETAWKSLAKVNGNVFGAGNSILLRRGCTWQGELAPQGAGTASAPARIGAWGEGPRPVIDAQGQARAAVRLQNQSNWEIRDIEATNPADERGETYRCGILVENRNGGTTSNIRIADCYVHDVTSSFRYVGDYHPHSWGGIAVNVTGSTATDRYDDVLIENCTVERAGRTGIVVWDNLFANQGEASTRVVIRGCTVRDIDSDGILTFGCDGSLIEHCLADGCGSYREDDQFNGSAAIWCTRGRNCVIQYNEACNTHALEGNDDGTGFDIDMDAIDCIVQYNYSHDNEGGFMLFVDASESSGSIVRYNISQNDRRRIFMIAGGVTPGTQIYNNTVWIAPGLDTRIIQHGWDDGSGQGDINAAWSFRNNLICNFGSGDYEIPGTGGTFAGNLYWGNHPAGEPAEAGKLTVDPQLVDPGSATTGLASLGGYRLREGSPAVNAGVIVARNGGQDLFGNPVSRSGRPTIGAFEPNGLVEGEVSLVDPLDDWSLSFSHSDNLELDTSNPAFFGGDGSRAVRQNLEDAQIVYYLPGYRSATVTVGLCIWYPSLSTDNIRLYAAAEPDGEWQPLATRAEAVGQAVEGWQRYTVSINSAVPDGASYFKVVASDRVNEAWAIQIGQVELSDEAPQIVDAAVLDDQLASFDRMVFRTDNLTIASGDEANFGGDAQRVARTTVDEGYMAYRFADTRDFLIEAYLYKPALELYPPESIEVYVAPELDFARLVKVACRYTPTVSTDGWQGYAITPEGEIPAGEFFAVKLAAVPVPDHGWAAQIGRIYLTDKAPQQPDVRRIDDPCSSFDLTAWHSDNLTVDWGNEAAFDGDNARITRTSSAEAMLIYACAGVSDFTVDCYIYTPALAIYPAESIGVYVAPEPDPAGMTRVECRYTPAAATEWGQGYTIIPAGEIPAGSYLIVKLDEVPVADHGWAAQIGNIAVTY